jgi:hypothetical protein
MITTKPYGKRSIRMTSAMSYDFMVAFREQTGCNWLMFIGQPMLYGYSIDFSQ